MGLTRRDVLGFAGGSAAGLLLTPVPWKVLDDLSIWTQNWSWTPRLARGEITTRFSACTLCPEACGVEAHCTGAPFQLAGVAAHPSGRGALCPAGVAAHHVAYHPGRIRQVLHHGRPAQLAEAVEAVHTAKGTIAILDERPGRAVSELYRRFAAQARTGLYLTPPPREDATLAMLRELVETPPGAFGIDLERTRTLLSFGAPVLDGWAAPGRVWAARAQFRLIQIEPRQSRTADLADLWLPIRPGTEAALALGIAHILLRDNLTHPNASRASDFAAYRALAGRFTPDVVARSTGIDPERLLSAAREFASGAPAIAIGGGDPGGGPLGEAVELAIAGLNLLTGSVGRRGGLLPRREIFETRGASIHTVPDGSIGALIVDAAPSSDLMPWEVVKRKLAQDAVVIALAAFPEGLAARADFLVPVPAPFETLQDTGAPFDAPRAMFGLSAPLLPPSAGAVSPSLFLAKVAAALALPESGAEEAVLKERVAAVFSLRRGTVLSYSTGESAPVTASDSAEKLWTALEAGGCWLDDESPEAAPGRFRLLGKDAQAAEHLLAAAEGPSQPAGEYPVTLAPHGWRAAIAGAPSPLMTKLYQESALRPPSNAAAMHPETARSCGLEDGCAAVIETAGGAARARVCVSSAVMPGTVEAAIAPGAGAIDICRGDDQTWRLSAARIRRAS